MVVHRAIKIIKESAINFYEDGNFTYASSIAFYFILSIIPFISLGIILVNSLQSYMQIDYAEMLTPHILNLLPFIPEDKIMSLLNIKAVSTANVFGLLILPVVSGFIFSVMDNAYRKIFNLPTRHLILSQMIYPIISVSVIILLFIANIFFSIISTYITLILERFPEISSIINYIPTITSSFLSTIIFLVFYILLINLFVGIEYKIKFRYKLASAGLFYLLWFVAKAVFTYYLRVNTNMSIIYGPLTSSVIILLWIYYSSIVLLFTLEVLHSLHIEFGKETKIIEEKIGLLDEK